MKRAFTGRRRVVTIAAVVAVAAAATGLSVLPNALASDGLGTGTAPTKPFHAAKAPRKVPEGAVRTTRKALPREGARAQAFSSRVKSPRIVGGELASAADYPWIVGIQTIFSDGTDANNQFIWYLGTCTGTVISPTKVLTAGHCATDMSLGDSAVIAGRNNLNDDTSGFVARVQSTWTDPTFNLAALNSDPSVAPIDDVTVLTLKQPLPATYVPVSLAGAGSPTAYDEASALIVGYGITGTGNQDPGTLRKATVPIHSSANCTANLGANAGYDNSRMLCAGTLGAGTGVDTCNGDSGGPILVDGVEVGITDWGIGDCAVSYYGVYERISTYRSAIDADVAWPGVINPDWSGDGHSDLLARDSDGELVEYSGSGFVDDGHNGINPDIALVGTGWGNFTKLFRVMNWNGDGTPSIMARSSDGKLIQYRSDGQGGFAGTPTAVGSSWGAYTDIMVTNNWTGDHHPNLIGRNAKGDMYLYTSNGAGGWENNGIGIKIGTAWNGFDTVLTPGDWKGDNHQALIGRKPNGQLYLYESDGAGGWMNNGIGVLIGTGWNGFKTFMSPGDLGGDNKVDLIGITPSGVLKLYSTDGHGNWLNNGAGRQLGAEYNWSEFNTVF